MLETIGHALFWRPVRSLAAVLFAVQAGVALLEIGEAGRFRWRPIHEGKIVEQEAPRAMSS